MKAKYKRPWSIMEGSVDVAPTGARIVGQQSWGGPGTRYLDEDNRTWPARALTEMDADAAYMRSMMTREDRAPALASREDLEELIKEWE